MQQSESDPLVLPPYISKVLISEERILTRVKELADQIVLDYQSEEQAPLIVCIMKGGLLFQADLIRAIGIRLDIECDFMVLSSYDGDTESSGEVKILFDLHSAIHGRDVIIVEDIVDTGRTMHALLDLLLTRHPKAIRVCTLLDKPSRRVVKVPTDYVGFSIGNEFVIGYGMDIGEKKRQLPFIAVYKQAA